MSPLGDRLAAASQESNLCVFGVMRRTELSTDDEKALTSALEGPMPHSVIHEALEAEGYHCSIDSIRRCRDRMQGKGRPCCMDMKGSKWD